MQEVKSRHVRQKIIEKDEIKRGLAENDEGVGGGAAARHLMADSLQALANEQGDVVVVFDQEESQGFGHSVFLAAASRRPNEDGDRRAGARFGVEANCAAPSRHDLTNHKQPQACRRAGGEALEQTRPPGSPAGRSRRP